MNLKSIVSFYLLVLSISVRGQQFLPADTGQSLWGIPPSVENCSFFRNNSAWLPDAYISNAECACLKTPNDSQANRIRKALQMRLNATPDSIKQLAQKKKEAYTSKQISKRRYRKFVLSTLTPLIYSDHVLAYRLAGCKGDPAPKWAWRKVTTMFYSSSLIWFSIRCLGGSCSGCTCKW